MNTGWRQTIARSVRVFEYLLAGDPRTILSLVALLFVSWYLLSEYLWQPLIGSRHDELEYAFLACPLIAFGGRAMLLRRALDSLQAEASARLPLPNGEFPPAMVAAMCEHMASVDPRTRGFFRWMARMLHKADPARPLPLNDIPLAWRRRRLYWVGLISRATVVLTVAILLVSPWQFYVGDTLARGLDRLFGDADYVRWGETCQIEGNCQTLAKQDWPGDVIEMKGDAPDFGRLRIGLCNWPRSGRYVHFRSEGMYGVDQNYAGVDLTIPAKGRVAEFTYFVSDTNVWALWAEVEYFSFCGERLTTATYSGLRVPAIVPPSRYRNTKR